MAMLPTLETSDAGFSSVHPTQRVAISREFMFVVKQVCPK